MKSLDARLRFGTVAAAVAALLGATTGEIQAAGNNETPISGSAISEMAVAERPRKSLVLQPPEVKNTTSGWELASHSSHSSHSSHVSGASDSGGSYTPPADIPVAPPSPATPPDDTPLPAPPAQYTSADPDVSEHVYTLDELASHSDHAVSHILLTIYAAYGYSFPDKDGNYAEVRKYFLAQPWYKPDTDSFQTAFGRMTAIAQANVNLLTKVQQDRLNDKE